ncbi:unnamed protein product, partial [Rotaria magnacalcarata]
DNNSCSNNNSDLDDDHFNDGINGGGSNSSSNNCTTSSNNSTIEHANLGHMLISFLELYGVYFNYAKLGIRVQTPNQSDRSAGFI